MKRIILLLLAMAIASFCLFPSSAQACTIFTAHRDGSVLAGNNEDWMYLYRTSLSIIAPSKHEYGRIFFCLSGYVQGGMNEHGLFYDEALSPKSEVPYNEDKPTIAYLSLGDKVLSECATVNEAVNMLKGYNIPEGSAFHLLFADASGDSAVLEWAEGEFRVLKGEGDYQLITNFLLSNPELGNYPCTRYENAQKQLAKGAYSVDAFRDILSTTAQNWGEGGTLYSNVYDLLNRVVYVYDRGEFGSFSKVDLSEMIKTMQRGERKTMDLSELSYGNTTVTINPTAEPAPSLTPAFLAPSTPAVAEPTVEPARSTAADDVLNRGLTQTQMLIGIGALTLIALIALFVWKVKKCP